MNIVHISDDIKREFRLDSEGKAFISIRGAARLLGIDDGQLSKSCRAEFSSSKFVQYLSLYGIESAEFSVTGISDVALVGGN